MTTNWRHDQAPKTCKQSAGLASERTPARLAALLREAGQRATPQRLAILGAFSRPGEHLTADEVFARVEQLAPALNRSTVYRTLERLGQLGLITETDLGGGVRRYELCGGGRHHHLICHVCGQMLELDDVLVEPLRRGVEARYGFEPSIDHLALWGLCSRCRQTEPEPGD